jgi:hypothetical protein
MLTTKNAENAAHGAVVLFAGIFLSYSVNLAFIRVYIFGYTNQGLRGFELFFFILIIIFFYLIPYFRYYKNNKYLILIQRYKNEEKSNGNIRGIIVFLFGVMSFLSVILIGILKNKKII